MANDGGRGVGWVKKVEDRFHLFRRFVDASGEGMGWADLDGQIQYANATLARFIGVADPAAAVGVSVLQLYDEPTRRMLAEQVFPAILTGRVWTGELVLRPLNGPPMPTRNSLFVLHDGDEEPVCFANVVHDLTAVKRAERELAKHQEHLEEIVAERTKALRLKDHIIESSSAAIATADLEGRLTYANPALLKMWGFETLDEIQGRHYSEHWLTGERANEVTEALLRVGRWSGEIEARRRDGGQFHAQVSAAAVRDPDGNPVALTSSSVDVTERRRAEERFRLAANQASDHIYEWHVHDDKLLWFGDIDDALGVQPGEFPQTIEAWLSRIHPDDLAQLTNAVERHRTSPDAYQVEYRIARKDGSWRTWEDRAVPILDAEGNPRKWIGVCTDITERRRAVEALRSSEEQYRLLAENVTDVIWTMDLQLRFTYVSPSITQLRGYSVEEAMAQSLSDIMVPESVDAVSELFARQIRFVQAGDDAGWHPIVFEVEQPCKDGSTVFTSTSAKLLEGSDGLPRMIVGVSRNITARKRAEAERAKLETQLHHSQKMEALGLLAGGVAHDFNNVLCAILGNAELTRYDLPADDPNRDSIDEIIRASEQAAALTRQLLAFSRKQIIEPKIIDLSQLVESLHTMLIRLIGEDIILRTRARKGLGRVRVDPSQVEQVVLNLVVNARDAMPSGGELLIETKNVLLDEDQHDDHGSSAPGAHVMLAVSDKGCGMSAEVREKIFEPFYTTKELGRGTGLGLATIYGIVKQHAGRIEVRSEPDRGSSFEIYFPRIDDGAEVHTPPVARRASRGHETILVVEDEKMVLSLAVRILASHGYHVLAVSTGAKALQLAEQHKGRIDLLLTDVVMPHMNGRELAEAMAGLQPGIKVLYTSGYAQSAIGNHGVLDEGVQFIAKPYSLDTLLGKVREVLEKDLET